MNVSDPQSQDILLMHQDSYPNMWAGEPNTMNIDDLLADQRLDISDDAMAIPPELSLSQEPALSVQDSLEQLLAISGQINGPINEELEGLICQGTCVADTSQRLDFLTQQINDLVTTVAQLSIELGGLLEMEHQTQERLKTAINQLGRSIQGNSSGDGRS
ncbi:hypothetical protein BO94DRAFT_542108 [Aspergillus sclerotioniger CBS 115572]|uniref:Uncharacterized protein n=1 Tax=Aspergillus sclerotioniger CBS 115572 TaxID=1450535 RepID=A0A317XGI7_9EURO|nr:hypothetical protein BO94DRAFT_542108 [Aspergillus sclerotioniger CBS 115572]PWY96030.1 hypothetical protein BO94DRAFT_542108 [Aspergillus sclerotioniger CBS 115572]